MKNIKQIQVAARNMIAGAIMPSGWLDCPTPEKTAALMVALIDAAVSIAFQVFGRERGLDEISKMVNSAVRRFHGD